MSKGWRTIVPSRRCNFLIAFHSWPRKRSGFGGGDFFFLFMAGSSSTAVWGMPVFFLFLSLPHHDYCSVVDSGCSEFSGTWIFVCNMRPRASRNWPTQTSHLCYPSLLSPPSPSSIQLLHTTPPIFQPNTTKLPNSLSSSPKMSQAANITVEL